MVSPNGRYLLVNAPGSTAPDENAGGPLQIFIYDTQTDEWSCASCLPSGAGGGSLPLNKREFFNNRQVRAVTDSGEAFFTSQARLTSQDVNGNEDVYAYKDGALKLISPGTAPYNATFMDAGADGSDVYFKTEQRLTPGADKIGYSVYDARVGGGFPEELSPPPCQGEACQAASAAPLLSEPSVASGANQRARKKSRCRAPMKAKSSAKAKKKEQHCGKTRKHRGKAKAKRAGSSRRAGR
jgi:hypothetical protein